MNEEHVLILRQPIDDGAHAPIMRERRWSTTVLARGSWDDMQARWVVADKRARALGIDGNVAVRSADESLITGLPESASRLYEPEEARLAIVAGDTVRVRIYGNHYEAVVTSASTKSVNARFAARTRNGGWGGEPAVRERRFPIYGPHWDRTVLRVTQQAQGFVVPNNNHGSAR